MNLKARRLPGKPARSGMHLVTGIVSAALASIVVAAPVQKRSANVVFAPYMFINTPYDPTAYSQSTGTNHFTLAFITAGPNGIPYWEQSGQPASSKYYADKIAAIRSTGGDVSISFGGQAGTELALLASDPQSLATTYLNVLNTYNVTWADFDVEGSTISNITSVDLRNKAIAIVQSKQPNIKVSYTLPVAHTGLVSSGITLIQNAASNKVKPFGFVESFSKFAERCMKARVDVLNIMTMDYYESIPYVDANGNSLMGQYAIQAVQGTYSQVGNLVGSIGICPGVGINDDRKEVFTLADAAQVATFAKSTAYVSWVSFWVVQADENGNSDGKGAPSRAYAKVFVNAFSGSGSSTTSTTTTTPASSKTTVATTAPTTSTTTTTTGKATTLAPVTTLSSNCYPLWSSTVSSYNGGAQVSYNNVNYVAKWWAGSSDVPGTSDAWNAVGACGSVSSTTLAGSSTTSTTTSTILKPSTTTNAAKSSTKTTTTDYTTTTTTYTPTSSSTTTTTTTGIKTTVTTTAASSGPVVGQPCTGTSQCYAGSMYYCQQTNPPKWILWYVGC
ncbi:UNVERIFIED_CONTAM: hypothetical protein HDU68_006521 [Siphonaria sp. JEL0065]|nr:hypothetical protein HDU68_006521 [Siphonaria sp. JEL0065]